MRQTSSSLSTDTHSYDNKLRERKKLINSQLERISLIPRGDKLTFFGALYDALTSQKGFDGMTNANYRTIIRDYEMCNNSANYDPTNDFFAIDLLYLCGELCFRPGEIGLDTCEMLNIQLSEMTSGMCPQGRTARLFQVITSREEYL